MIAIVSAIRLPGMSSPTDWRWMKLGSWIRIRNGWSVPSLIAYDDVLAARDPRWPRRPAPAGVGCSRGSLAMTGPSGISWRHWSMIRRLCLISSIRSR